jgi:hypothetical protein
MAYQVLRNVITAMVLVSLHPFAFWRILVIAAIVLGSAVCFADSLFMAQKYPRRTAHTASRVPSVVAPKLTEVDAPTFDRVSLDAPVSLWKRPATDAESFGLLPVPDTTEGKFPGTAGVSLNKI